MAVDRSRRSIRISRERSRPGILALGLAATLLYAGFNWIQSAEVIDLEAWARGGELAAARLLFVNDVPYLWVLESSPEAGWLAVARSGLPVTVRERGSAVTYRAREWSDPEALERVEALFREKYGMRARLEALRDPVTVRLERTY